ncbi:MAG: glutathione-regulated potassium-efflux system ancillary protein KefC [Alphaproteobacteria bacterium]|nr:MAG: glutathione-regulated potassium-efflux system ancillary protein KefC [Caulobacteraceae bacterium]TPW08289.1 MAG: glutathione-regulated potassium-efflux system ancillary protein KefC [Alphaproteobacteria bacterium]
MNPEFLLQSFVFLVAAVVMVPVAKRLGLGSVLGYIVAGVLIGPFGLKLFGDPEGAMHAAEFGVVIMLFLIGLELQPALLWRMRTSIIGVGGAQVVLTGLAIGGVSLAFGLDWRVALAVGLILALSSTAIVMQSMREKALTETDSGRTTFAVLLFQDIAVIPMLALFPLLATFAPSEATGHVEGGLLADAPNWLRVLATLAAIAAVVLAGRFIMRPIFRIIARTRMQELFTATALVIVVGTTLLMESVSLSPALGAFVAGVVLADSEFRHEIESDIEPFRGLLLGLFFVSVGASIDFALLFAQPMLILGLAALLIAVKAAVLFGIQRLFGQGKADSVTVALMLAQGGEFAFVLFAFAQGEGVLPASIVDPLTVVVALSMAATPLLFIAAERIAGQLVSPISVRLEEAIESNKPHAIVAGYGRVGQTVGRLLEANGYRTSVLEHDADQVDALRGFGRKVNYGDASRIDLLRAAGAEDAQVIVVAIDDKAKALEIVDTVRRHFPHLKIVARAYDRRHAYELMAKEVDALERETFESSVRLGVKTLAMLGFGAYQSERAGELFRRYDEKLLGEMAGLWGGDFAAYQKVVRDRTAMFEDLMRTDMAAMRSANDDEVEAVEAEAGEGGAR